MKKKEKKGKGMAKNIGLILALLIVLGLIALLGYGYCKKSSYKPSNPVATMVVKDYGTIKIELYPDMAPNTVKNFITLANNGFYDGLTYHRIIKDFMIQGGDPKGDGSGSPNKSAIDKSIEKNSDQDKEYNIKGEFIKNDYEKNTLKLEKGVIAMARSDYSSYAQYYGRSLIRKGYDSAGSQFFIMTTDDNISLTGSYAGFGRVVEGLDIVEKIAATKVKKANENSTEESTPEKAPIIESIKIETFGVEYGAPETVEPFDMNSLFSSQLSY